MDTFEFKEFNEFLKSVILFYKIGVGGIVSRWNGTLLFKYFDACWKYSDIRKVVGVFRCKVIGVFKKSYTFFAYYLHVAYVQ